MHPGHSSQGNLLYRLVDDMCPDVHVTQEFPPAHILGETVETSKRVAREYAAEMTHYVALVVVLRRFDEEHVKTRRLLAIAGFMIVPLDG